MIIQLNQKESDRLQKFERQHFKKGCLIYTLHVTATGIGYCFEAECPTCGEKKDVTDCSDW